LTTVENIADAITHTRFLGTEKTSDAIVLMKTLQVLYCLMMSPEGEFLPNESVCEIMMSCFRFCFEVRLSGMLYTMLYTMFNEQLFHVNFICLQNLYDPMLNIV